MTQDTRTEWSDEVIHAYLTRDGQTPLSHYFVMHDDVHEWQPSIGLVVTHRYRDEARKHQIIAYLAKQQLVCSSQSRVKELAAKHGWVGWGRPFPLVSPDTDGDV